MNMSYCKYRNTLLAIKELDELLDNDYEELSKLSADEFNAMKNIVRKAIYIAEQVEFAGGFDSYIEDIESYKETEETEDEEE